MCVGGGGEGAFDDVLNTECMICADTLICLMNNGTCDPKCVNGTTQSCSFGSTQPTPQATGSQNGGKFLHISDYRCNHVNII